MIINSILLTLLPGLAIATNDWSKPCTSGSCSYESGDGINTAWSNLVINAASTNSLSDITSAAGWQILHCDPKSIDPQDIRLVCVGHANECSHLFNGGAENTIVRLPENCAGGPFARVIRTWIHQDQTLPGHLVTSGKVHGLALDFDFSKIPESRGKVHLTVAATNSPAQRNAIRPASVKRSLQPIRHANLGGQVAAVVRDFTSSPIKRSPSSIGDVLDDVKNGATDAVNKVVDGANKAVDTVKDQVNGTVDAAKDAVTQAAQQVGSIIDSATGDVLDFVIPINGSTFNKTFSKTFDAISVRNNFRILDQSISCPQQGKVPAFEADLKVDVDVAAMLTADVGFIVTGSFVPPNIESLAFTGGLSGHASATFNISSKAEGAFHSLDLRLFELGLPGLDFPGIISIGPSFSINANAKAELGVVADISVATSIAFPEVQFTFPASAGRSFANVNPQDVPIKLHVGALATLNGHVEAHLIPRLEIGVNLLNGAAEATVFATVDSSAKLDFTLDARVTGTPVNGTVSNPTVDFNHLDSTLGGSIALDLGVAIDVGAEAALLPFWDQQANFQVFQKTYPIFEKKFGDQASKRSVRTMDDGRLSKRTLTCPGAGEGSPVNTLIDAVAKGTA